MYNEAMRFYEKLGVWPSLLIGSALLIVGLFTINYIMNSWWPFDISRLDLVRATVLDRVDAASLLEAANIEIILVF